MQNLKRNKRMGFEMNLGSKQKNSSTSFKHDDPIKAFYKDALKEKNKAFYNLRKGSPIKKKGKLKEAIQKGVEMAKDTIKRETSSKNLKKHAGNLLRSEIAKGARGNYSAAEKSAASAMRKPKGVSAGKTFDISESRKSKKAKKKIKSWEKNKPKQLSEQEKFLAMDAENKKKSPAKSINKTRRGAGVAGVYKGRRRASLKKYQDFSNVARKPKRKIK